MTKVVSAFSPAPLSNNVQYSAPVAAATVTVLSSVNHVIIDPAGTLATLTVTLPATPPDGYMVTICSSQIVTTLTLNGATIIGGIVVFAVGGFAKYIYNLAQNKYYRCG